MQRRKFIKETGMVAIGIGVFGNVSWSKERFIGDTPTTTDVLGPFYRPGAPTRSNINPQGYTGQLFHVSGTVSKEDGKTPFKNALVEIWQCDENRVYDNTSDEFKHRGSQKTGADGKYHFIGMHPIPYPAGENSELWRPAHIHLLISGEEQQDLITQIYLEGDPYLEKDIASASPNAIKRILKISRNSKNEEAVRFDIVMAKEFKPDDSVFEKLAGVYKMNDKSMMEFYRKDDLLFLKWNSQIREGLSYKGSNTFAGGITNNTTANFQLHPNSDVKVKVHFKTITSGEFDLEGIKTFKYKN
jgi:protocatechuate 3,4-dioxygenase beta subunit